jgi:Uma2 family endonuclease
MAAVTPKLMTAEEFLGSPEPADGSKQELVQGVIATMPPPGFLHGRVQTNTSSLLWVHARKHKVGQVVVESGLITERDPDTVRGPDISFWSKERLPLDQPPPVGYPDVAADLCVEVLSPGMTVARMWAKVQEYFNRGVRMVWIIDPENRTVTVYRSPHEARLLHESAMLSGEDVVPGFICRVSELFE